MSHLDEGTLHALLDGELDAKEVREIQAHLGSCSACGTRLQSVKEIAAESDRLVSVIEFPGTPRRPAALDPAPARDPISDELAAAPEFASEASFETASETDLDEPARLPARPIERRIGAEPIYHEAPPVILVPDEYAWGERRRRMAAFGRWAALLVVAVGAGYIASEVRKTGAPATIERAAPFDDSAPVVSSAEETSRPDSAQGFGKQSGPSAVREDAATPAPTRAQRAATPPPARPAPEPVTPARKPAPAEPDRADRLANAAVGGAGSAAEDTEERDDSRPAADESESVPPPDVREEAAEAMAELDRERRLERAAAATAALDSDKRREVSAARNTAASAPVAPAPAPRTLEQRSNIYLRIGLDEAARQLGRPVHVIEGMQQQFMGLAQGAASPAADPTRPVVRVVYQDNQGRMILLDQQRIRPGQAWSTSETRWVVGEIGLSLRGEPAPEILRNLRPRVR